MGTFYLWIQLSCKWTRTKWNIKFLFHLWLYRLNDSNEYSEILKIYKKQICSKFSIYRLLKIYFYLTYITAMVYERLRNRASLCLVVLGYGIWMDIKYDFIIVHIFAFEWILLFLSSLFWVDRNNEIQP